MTEMRAIFRRYTSTTSVDVNQTAVSIIAYDAGTSDTLHTIVPIEFAELPSLMNLSTNESNVLQLHCACIYCPTHPLGAKTCDPMTPGTDILRMCNCMFCSAATSPS